ncbi:long-chain-acyl-CoA synthetase [Allobranchiibius sp. CTAmp26]|uniref:long-chain-acyl-CoA synthetase n=1 Tax=Allobranchiibius sp. CTAmp26 TaxID=2815214 RepID=UPI001AA0B3BF|nr:long-chain-acyl-CoA synthetase [Allobranchiibius sp. CTAmp26]MBO1754008.1 long-chain-acyl-CoA synthetase [Allobranchiibius sp. CTAmp26]
MSTTTRQRVTLLDFAKGSLRALPELRHTITKGPGLTLKPTAVMSIGSVFQEEAAAHPDRPFLKGGDRVITYGEANAQINRYAYTLIGEGVQRGDVVGLMAANDIENLLVMLAVVKLGAVAGLLNYNQRGEVLAHSIGILGARAVVIGDDLGDDLASAGDIVTSQHVLTMSELKQMSLGASSEDPKVTAQIVANERAYFIFTSGTTGMPKASVMSHFRWLKSYGGLGALGVRLNGEDTLYCSLPLYHNNSVTVALGAVLHGGAAMAVAPKFSASKFWDDVRHYDATSFVYIGELCRYLLAQKPSPDDTRHGIRVIVGNGLRADIWKEFQERFAVKRIAEFYGASECNIAFINALDVDETAGMCPLPHKVVAYDDETGEPRRNARGRLETVRVGEVGLLLAKVTDRQPFDGYTDDDASERKLVRNGFKSGDCWFNTGDLVRKQGMQHVAFVDRVGDTFRWKGENVATTQVEAALGHAHDVEDCTVYGVEVAGTDGKAGMAAVQLVEGASFDGRVMADHLIDSLPTYAVPLFIRLVATLEHTSTFKSRKVELRDQGFQDAGGDEVFVLAKAEYVPLYDGYADEVAAGKAPSYR